MEDIRLEGSQQNRNTCLSAMMNYVSNSNSALPSANNNKFTIPEFKPKASSTHKLIEGAPSTLGGSTSNINQFLMKQMEQQAKADRFNPNLPKLERAAKEKTGFVIPELKSAISLKALPKSGIATESDKVTKSIEEFQDQLDVRAPQTEDHIIDLTTALSATRIGNSSSNNNILSISQSKKTPKSVAENFEIPFIECDRQQQIPQTDTYCIIDISNVRFHHNIAPPSTLGRILACKAKKTRISQTLTQKAAFKAKHKIDRFSFDTKSPDDIVILNLSRFTRAQ